MAIEEVIGPETADQTAARDTREFWASVEGSTVKESAEFKAAQLVAEENTRFLLQEMAKEGVTVSEMKRDEYLKKSRDHAAEPFVPKQKYPEVVTDWGKPKDEVTILPETERTEISAIDSIKNVLVSSADSENAKKYAGLQNASVDTLMGKWRDYLSSESQWKRTNPDEANGIKADTMTTQEKLQFVGRGTITLTRPSFVSSDGSMVVWNVSSANARVNDIPLTDKEYASFQDTALTKLGVLKDNENEEVLRTIVQSPVYDGSRGVYDRDNGTLSTKLDNGATVKLNFSRDWFEVYIDSKAVSSTIDSPSSK